MALRVVAGSHRGRRLETPSGESTRPTADRVREAVFNSLDAHGLIEDVDVLDLFAGSGAMGIEALSRGAARVTFVDSSRDAVAVIRANLESCGLAGRANVVMGDSVSFIGTDENHYGLVILDPPYSFDRWDDILAHLDAGAVVIESDRPVLNAVDHGEFGNTGYEVIRERRYGTTVVTIAISRRRDDHGGQSEDRQ